MTGLGLRYNEGKPRVDLIPPAPLLEMGRLYGAGAIKYEANNWRKGLLYSNVAASMMRHYLAWLGGEDIDQETGCHHMAAIAWGAFAILQFEADKKIGLDDRYKPEGA